MHPEISNQPSAPRYTLTLLPDQYAICRLPADAAIPTWAVVALESSADFVTISRTRDELSVICEQRYLPMLTSGAALLDVALQVEADWRAFRVEGPFAFSVIGVLAGLASALAAANVSLCAISTYDTDYLLVKAKDIGAATHALTTAGHAVRSESGD